MKLPAWNDLNNEERWIGAVYGALLALNLWGFWGAWWAISLVPACMYLWAAGGAKKEAGGNKLYRRAGCSILPGLLAAVSTGNLWALPSVPLAWWILAWGYGIPTYAPERPDNDEGSLLGRWAYNLAGKIWDGPVPIETLQVRATAIVRTVIYICLGFAWSPIWILKLIR